MATKEYPHLFQYSILSAVPPLLLSSVLMCGAAFSCMSTGRINGLGVFIFIAALPFAFLGVRGFLNDTPALMFGPQGLWIPKLGFQSWQEVYVTIEERKNHVARGGGNDVTYLVVNHRHTNQELEKVVMQFTKSPSEIGQLLKASGAQLIDLRVVNQHRTASGA